MEETKISYACDVLKVWEQRLGKAKPTEETADHRHSSDEDDDTLVLLIALPDVGSPNCFESDDDDSVKTLLSKDEENADDWKKTFSESSRKEESCIQRKTTKRSVNQCWEDEGPQIKKKITPSARDRQDFGRTTPKQTEQKMSASEVPSFQQKSPLPTPSSEAKLSFLNSGAPPSSASRKFDSEVMISGIQVIRTAATQTPTLALSSSSDNGSKDSTRKHSSAQNYTSEHPNSSSRDFASKHSSSRDSTSKHSSSQDSTTKNSRSRDCTSNPKLSHNTGSSSQYAISKHSYSKESLNYSKHRNNMDKHSRSNGSTMEHSSRKDTSSKTTSENSNCTHSEDGRDVSKPQYFESKSNISKPCPLPKRRDLTVSLTRLVIPAGYSTSSPNPKEPKHSFIEPKIPVQNIDPSTPVLEINTSAGPTEETSNSTVRQESSKSVVTSDVCLTRKSDRHMSTMGVPAWHVSPMSVPAWHVNPMSVPPWHVSPVGVPSWHVSPMSVIPMSEPPRSVIPMSEPPRSVIPMSEPCRSESFTSELVQDVSLIRKSTRNVSSTCAIAAGACPTSTPIREAPTDEIKPMSKLARVKELTSALARISNSACATPPEAKPTCVVTPEKIPTTSLHAVVPCPRAREGTASSATNPVGPILVKSLIVPNSSLSKEAGEFNENRFPKISRLIKLTEKSCRKNEISHNSVLRELSAPNKPKTSDFVPINYPHMIHLQQTSAPNETIPNAAAKTRCQKDDTPSYPTAEKTNPSALSVNKETVKVTSNYPHIKELEHDASSPAASVPDASMKRPALKETAAVLPIPSKFQCNFTPTPKNSSKFVLSRPIRITFKSTTNKVLQQPIPKIQPEVQNFAELEREAVRRPNPGPCRSISVQRDPELPSSRQASPKTKQTVISEAFKALGNDGGMNQGRRRSIDSQGDLSRCNDRSGMPHSDTRNFPALTWNNNESARGNDCPSPNIRPPNFDERDSERDERELEHDASSPTASAPDVSMKRPALKETAAVLPSPSKPFQCNFTPTPKNSSKFMLPRPIRITFKSTTNKVFQQPIPKIQPEVQNFEELEREAVPRPNPGPCRSISVQGDPKLPSSKQASPKTKQTVTSEAFKELGNDGRMNQGRRRSIDSQGDLSRCNDRSGIPDILCCHSDTRNNNESARGDDCPTIPNIRPPNFDERDVLRIRHEQERASTHYSNTLYGIENASWECERPQFPTFDDEFSRESWGWSVRSRNRENDNLRRASFLESNALLDSPSNWPGTLRCRWCCRYQIEVVLFPCAHAALCLLCSEGLHSCPFCQRPVVEARRIFLPTR